MDNVFEIRAQGAGPFRLALLTDLHFNGNTPISAAITRHFAKKQIERQQPDMAAVLGDIAINDSGARTRMFTDFMDSLGLPWTAVLGNHEGENDSDVPRCGVIEHYQTSPRYLGLAEQPGVTGYGNQMIAVLDEAGKAMQLLYFLDSGCGRKTHGWIQPDQLDWMSRAAALYPGTPGMAFFHVPSREFVAAHEACQHGQAELLHGGLHEKICPGGTEEQNQALLATARELGIWAFVCGHDHRNDFDIRWQGLRYIYAQASGYALTVYGGILPQRVRGCTVVEIGQDGSVGLRQNFNVN